MNNNIAMTKTKLFHSLNPYAPGHVLIKFFESLGYRVEVRHNRYSQETFEHVEKTRKHWYFNHEEITKQMEARLLAGHDFSNGPHCTFAPRGGSTTVQLIKDGRVYTGTAHCSIMDNFCRNDGIKAAFERACNAIDEDIYCEDQTAPKVVAA